MKPSLKNLRKAEHKAIKDYSSASSTAKPHEVKTLHHIKGEEKEHARELTKLIRKRGQRFRQSEGLGANG